MLYVYSGIGVSCDAGTNLRVCLGPLSKSVNDLALWMKVVTEQKFYEGKHDAFTKLIEFDQLRYLKIQKP